VDGRVFCVHGGLSPNLHNIDQVQYRFCSLLFDVITCSHWNDDASSFIQRYS